MIRIGQTSVPEMIDMSSQNIDVARNDAVALSVVSLPSTQASWWIGMLASANFEVQSSERMRTPRSHPVQVWC